MRRIVSKFWCLFDLIFKNLIEHFCKILKMVYLKGRDLSNIWLIEISRKCFSENSETLMRTKNLKLNPKKFSKSWDYLIFISTVLPQIKIIFYLFWGTWNPGIGWGGGFNSHFALFLYFFSHITKYFIHITYYTILENI